MNTHHVNDRTGSEDVIAEEALAWLMRLRDASAVHRSDAVAETVNLILRRDAPAPEDPYSDPSVCNGAFFDWVKRSPTHVRVFMEFMELERRVARLDARAFAAIQHLIHVHAANIAPSGVQEGAALQTPVAVSDSAPAAVECPEGMLTAHPRLRPNRKWAIGGALVASCVAVTILAYYFAHRPQIYSTHVGEQQKQVLQDGSIVQLNTNSEVEVLFSRRAREVRLVRGEAFFVVTHNPERPFTVTSDDASVRARGTEFDMRETSHSAKVAVLGGTVEVTAINRVDNALAGALKTLAQLVRGSETTHATEFLSGGEMATISAGKVSRVVNVDINGALSWRQRRLVFHDAPLADIADEFNRYNRAQIRVEGTAAQDTIPSASFPTDGYQNFLRYAQNHDFSVMQEGDDWVIRSR